MEYFEKKQVTDSKYIQHSIETRIIRGEFGDGEVIPSLNTLAQYYNTTTNTMQKVLGTLVKDNILTPQKGKGFFLKPFSANILREKHRAQRRELLVELIRETESTGDDLIKEINEIKNANVGWKAHEQDGSTIDYKVDDMIIEQQKNQSDRLMIYAELLKKLEK